MLFRSILAANAAAVRIAGYPSVSVLLDASGDVTGRLYGVWGPPTAYVVDRRGRLLARLLGGHDWTSPAARRLLEEVLELR